MREVLVFGASGYSGLELCRLLARHPHAKVAAASASTLAGQKLRDHVPEHAGELTFDTHEATLAHARAGQLAFLATPAKVSAELAPKLLDRGADVIDLSGAHRLDRAEEFAEFYGFELPPLSKRAAYGLPELFPLSESTTTPRLIANPGCYATAAILAAAPLLKLKEPGAPLIIDGKSGVTGAGRTLEEKFLYSEVAESVRPYRIGKHQHTPEIERALRLLGGAEIKVSFNAHLIPMRRGLICSVYTPAAKHTTQAALNEAYRQTYQNHPFLRVVENRPPETGILTGGNFAEIHAVLDLRTHTISAFAALDNLGKGAAGQAIQNLNALLGLEPTTGLR